MVVLSNSMTSLFKSQDKLLSKSFNRSISLIRKSSSAFETGTDHDPQWHDDTDIPSLQVRPLTHLLFTLCSLIASLKLTSTLFESRQCLYIYIILYLPISYIIKQQDAFLCHHIKSTFLTFSTTTSIGLPRCGWICECYHADTKSRHTKHDTITPPSSKFSS